MSSSYLQKPGALPKEARESFQRTIEVLVRDNYRRQTVSVSMTKPLREYREKESEVREELLAKVQVLIDKVFEA